MSFYPFWSPNRTRYVTPYSRAARAGNGRRLGRTKIPLGLLVVGITWNISARFAMAASWILKLGLAPLRLAAMITAGLVAFAPSCVLVNSPLVQWERGILWATDFLELAPFVVSSALFG